jgi:hypothetical protein
VRGPAGPVGPSETIQVKRTDAVAIPAGALGAATLATISVPAGSWMFNTDARRLRENRHERLLRLPPHQARGSERLGEGHAARRRGRAGRRRRQHPHPGRRDVQRADAAVLRLLAPVGDRRRAARTWLLATRVGSLEDR